MGLITIRLVSLWKEEMWTQREDPVRTQGNVAIYKPRKEASEGSDPDHNVRLLAGRTEQPPISLV